MFCLEYIRIVSKDEMLTMNRLLGIAPMQCCLTGPYMTLSKILCKWKQDSAISLSLYLDSVFRNDTVQNFV